jgi:hypothetical protein
MSLEVKLTAHERLTPDRSLDLVRHSPAGFDWGYTGSGPAQLACALLFDYFDDDTLAHQCYIQFHDAVVSQLVCTGPADCWHLTGDNIEAALGTFQDHHALAPDGGDPSPSLPANWSVVSRTDRTLFQRRGIDHYVVLGEGSEEWLSILCAQGNRAYPAPLSTIGRSPSRTTLPSLYRNSSPRATTSSSRKKRRIPDGESSPLTTTYQLIERAVEAL